MNGMDTQRNEPSKRIVICCDGTWCGPLAGTKTNTRILADSFASAGAAEVNMYEQKEYGDFKCRIFYNKKTKTHVMYMPGIGLGTNFEGYLMNGGLALEFGKCCTTAYKYIVEHFQPQEHDTRIYMFGHSRGAFTTRAVAAMIHNCGILDLGKASVRDNLNALVEEVYDIYANKDPEYWPCSETSMAFRMRLSHPTPDSNPLVKPPIEYLGLLDTVGGLGVPKVNSGPGMAYERYDTDVSSDVLHVWQGLAAHDRLTLFTPTHITRPEGLDSSTGAKQSQAQAQKAPKSSASGGSADVDSVGDQGQGPGLNDTEGSSSTNSSSTLRELQSKTAGFSGSNRPTSAAGGGVVRHSTTEVWLPGAHYDVGRQKFVLFRQAAGWERVVSFLNKHFNKMGLNIDFNTEQADLALLEALKGLYNTSEDAREMLCNSNPVAINDGKEELAEKYKARTKPDEPQRRVDEIADAFATLLVKLAPCIMRQTASQDAYDKLVCGIATNGLPASLFSLWLLPVHWALDVVVKNVVGTSTPIVLADRHIPLYKKAIFVSTANLSTDYVTGVNGIEFKSKAFNTYRVASGRNLDDNGE